MFEQKVWWITGASSGIGAALAEALARKGARLILSGRNEAALAEVAQRVGGEPLILPFEVTDIARLPQIVAQAASWAAPHGGLYGLVNNAGISQRSLAIDTAYEVYQRIIDIDLMAPIALTQHVLPLLAQNGGGKIVSISSVAGIIGAPLRSAYSAAKAGLIAYSDSVRAETAISASACSSWRQVRYAPTSPRTRSTAKPRPAASAIAPSKTAWPRKKPRNASSPRSKPASANSFSPMARKRCPRTCAAPTRISSSISWPNLSPTVTPSNSGPRAKPCRRFAPRWTR